MFSIYELCGIHILWTLLHYIASNLYPMFCAELGIIGFIKSIFITQTPYCIALRWLIYNGGNAINHMWTSIAIWVAAKIISK